MSGVRVADEKGKRFDTAAAPATVSGSGSGEVPLPHMGWEGSGNIATSQETCLTENCTFFGGRDQKSMYETYPNPRVWVFVFQ